LPPAMRGVPDRGLPQAPQIFFLKWTIRMVSFVLNSPFETCASLGIARASLSLYP